MYEASARALVYRFLSLGFSFPEGEALAALQDEAAWPTLSRVVAPIPECQVALAEMKDTAEAVSTTEQSLKALQVEYTRLFINAVPRVPAPPYESVYLGQGRVMGEPASRVLAAYREAGLAPSQGWREPPDHVVVELEFAAYLLERQAEALAAGEAEKATWWGERAQAFLEAHLWRWLPMLAERVRASARHPFYDSLAALSGAWVASERERAGMVEYSPPSIQELM